MKCFQPLWTVKTTFADGNGKTSQTFIQGLGFGNFLLFFFVTSVGGTQLSLSNMQAWSHSQIVSIVLITLCSGTNKFKSNLLQKREVVVNPQKETINHIHNSNSHMHCLVIWPLDYVDFLRKCLFLTLVLLLFARPSPPITTTATTFHFLFLSYYNPSWTCLFFYLRCLQKALNL